MNRLRECRESKKLTLVKLSERLNEKENFKVSADALSKYERGEREPKLATWKKLANFFNVPVPYITGTDNEDAISNTIDNIDLNKMTMLGLLFYENEDNTKESLEITDIKLHKNMSSTILYGQKDLALKTINKYIDFLSKLKDMVNTFDSNKFMDDYLVNVVAEYYWNPNSTKLDKINNEIIEEIIKRVKEGNKELRDYVVKKFICNGTTIFESYLNYKKKHDENTEKLENYIKQEEELFKNSPQYKILKNILSDNSKD